MIVRTLSVSGDADGKVSRWLTMTPDQQAAVARIGETFGPAGPDVPGVPGIAG
ncbi:hypothetical protein GCM10008949_51650 [Deinococcus humi]|nr:hypothetical protein GCM10008949_51650 [Deinococcus humi]